MGVISRLNDGLLRKTTGRLNYALQHSVLMGVISRLKDWKMGVIKRTQVDGVVLCNYYAINMRNKAYLGFKCNHCA